MAIIVANEKEFVNFLNDGFETGIFKLKLKKLQDKTKRIMIIYKRSGQNISLYKKCDDGKKEFAIYSPEEDKVYIENGNEFIGLRTKYVEKEQFQQSTTHPLNINNQASKLSSVPNELDPLRKAKGNSQSISPHSLDNLKLQDNSSDKQKEIINLLQDDLKDAKKVWAILKNGEEIQMNNSIFEEADILYLCKRAHYFSSPFSL